MNEKNLKIAAYVAFGGLALYAAYTIVKKILETIGVVDSKEDKANAKDQEKALDQAKKDALELEKTRKKSTVLTKEQKRLIQLSYQKSKYMDLANQLFTAMDGIGTDNEAITSVFKQIKNVADLNELIIAYGTRTLSSGFLSGTPQNLASALVSEGNVDSVNYTLSKNKVYQKF